MTSRRDALRMMVLALGAAPLTVRAGLAGSHGPASRGDRRLFFDESDVDRIRSAADHPFLKPTFEDWRAAPYDEVEGVITKVLNTGDLLYDWGTGIEGIYRQAMLALLTDDEKHRELALVGLQTLRTLPSWDYLRDGGTDVLGLMRGSKAITATLLCLEVLGDHVPDSMREQLLSDVASKGCVPCDLTIYHMNNPEEAKGWGVDEVQQKVNAWDMSRWPWILAVNNLRAIPTMGLGLGALALELEGLDDRAPAWHAAAVDSAKRFLALLEPDGSYEEGISYVDFAFRTLFLFFEADYRLRGDIDWIREANFDGVIEYIAAMQNGRKQDGEPDIVNISDSRHTVFTTVPSWIANRSKNALAAYAANQFSRAGYFADFLWYRPERNGQPPEDRLKNVRLDLDWVVARTGWDDDDTVVSFRSGRPTNHEHADRNTFTLKARGERLLTEHFGASYNPEQAHWLLRLPIAHNAVLVDGAGHQYHKGEEGTNASDASASITQYRDLGNTVYWSSDATPAYRLVDERVQLVRRTMIFVKPDTLVLLDEVSASEPVRIQTLLHPDNRDGMAEIELFTGGEFSIGRPAARLRGRCYSNEPTTITERRLDLDERHGSFPYVEVETGKTSSIRLLTVLQVGEEGMVQVERVDSGWTLRLSDGTLVRIETGQGDPEVEISG